MLGNNTDKPVEFVERSYWQWDCMGKLQQLCVNISKIIDSEWWMQIELGTNQLFYANSALLDSDSESIISHPPPCLLVLVGPRVTNYYTRLFTDTKGDRRWNHDNDQRSDLLMWLRLHFLPNVIKFDFFFLGWGSGAKICV